MSEELKSCLFCGGDDIETTGPFYTFLVCNGCFTEGPVKSTRSEATAAWNARAGERE